jgi:hypothetical protein
MGLAVESCGFLDLDDKQLSRSDSANKLNPFSKERLLCV